MDGYDLHDLNMAVLDQLKQIRQGAGAFVAGVLKPESASSGATRLVKWGWVPC